MTRAIDRLIVSGAIDPDRPSERETPIGWVLERLQAEAELVAAGDAPIELERGDARLLVRRDRYAPAPVAVPSPVAENGQLALFGELPAGPPPRGVELPSLVPIPPPPERVRRLSYSALALFERCSYRFYAERIVGMRERRRATAAPDAPGGLAATEVGDAVHRLLEVVDLAAPVAPDCEDVRSWYPRVTDEELDAIRAFVRSYCESELARRVAALAGAAPERPFAFEHDGVLLHGRFDVLHRDGRRALVVDYKTNSLAEGTPEEIVEADYRLQRLVYALACFRAGADEVEVVYHFLERSDAVVATTFSRADVPALEAELSAAIATIQAGGFVPSPDEFTCAGCPALDVVCAGPRLRDEFPPAPVAAAV
jgi:hypothetical protein